MLMTICNRCGRKIPQGTICPCHHDEHRKQDIKFYNSTEWRKLRDSIKARANGCDEYVLATKGKMIAGHIVHHIRPADEYPSIRLLDTNLIYVSKDTHDMIHQAYRQGRIAKDKMQKELFHIVQKRQNKT